MDKFLLLSILSFFILLNFASAIEMNLTSYDYDSIVQIRQLKYEPYPVNPGEYFDFWINVQYTKSTGVTFQLIPEYPFSLDSNESAIRDYGTIVSPSLVLHYKIRVDKDAVEGTNTLRLNYKIGDIWYSEDFDIEIENSQTSFDAVIQETSGSTVSIAIANIGKNAANSVIVKIPQQESFKVTGTDGQMVGNLASGDYTIVSFDLVSTNDFSNMKSRNLQESDSNQTLTPDSNKLTVEIDYTDNIGARRISNLQLQMPNSFSGNSTSFMGNFPGRARSSWSVWYTVLIIFAVLIVLFILYKKFPNQVQEIFNKIKIFRKDKKKNSPDGNEIPDWVKNVKEKRKNK